MIGFLDSHDVLVNPDDLRRLDQVSKMGEGLQPLPEVLGLIHALVPDPQHLVDSAQRVVGSAGRRGRGCLDGTRRAACGLHADSSIAGRPRRRSRDTHDDRRDNPGSPCATVSVCSYQLRQLIGVLQAT
jgi:hypothetical protein